MTENNDAHRLEFVAFIARMTPWRVDEQSYDFPQDRECIFCGFPKYSVDDGEPMHDDGCMWIRARKIMRIS